MVENEKEGKLSDKTLEICKKGSKLAKIIGRSRRQYSFNRIEEENL